MNGAVPIASRPATFFFETLISLVGEIDPGLAGIALVDRSLRVVERDRHLSRWLPHPGQRCTECAVLLGMDEAILALIDGPRSSLVIPSIELASTGEPLCLAIAITWHAERGHFIIASYPDHRSPEGEWLLATERRQKRLAEERLQALGLHFEIEQARYRHIVEAGTDLVLRFTREHILTFANRAALDLSGAREHDMVGAPLRRFFGPHLDPRPWDALAAGNDAIASFEQEMRTAAGEQAWIWWHVSAVGGAPGAEFQAVGRDITVLHKLRQETERANANAEAAAATRERLRIARELHDTLIQSTMVVLAQIRLARALLAADPVEADPAALRAVLAQAEEATRNSIGEARGAVAEFRLRPDEPVHQAESVCEGIGRRFVELERRAAIRVALSLDDAVDRLSADHSLPLFKIVEEAIRNIERHAAAKSVSVDAKMRHKGEGTPLIEVSIRDDGCGFDPGTETIGHFGIVGMREQARFVGGSLVIESAVGKGTTVIIYVPPAEPAGETHGGRRRWPD